MSSEIISRIQELKRKRNAVILVHNYQTAEVQDIADFLGDSLDLSRTAAQTKADVIVFCGVHFMAETASILCPDKKILLPDIHAGCPMAEMITVDQVEELKRQHPKALVVSYINTTADVKTVTDICCTSANAVAVVNAAPADEIIFIPDRNLGSYVASQTKKKVILANGFCPTHQRILPEDIERSRREHPGAEVVVHPECRPEVVAMADKVASTSGMCHYARETKSAEIIVGTEVGIIHRLQKENPGKKFYPATTKALCDNMKKTNLDKVLWALEDMQYEVSVPDEVRAKARNAIDKMLEYSRND